MNVSVADGKIPVSAGRNHEGKKIGLKKSAGGRKLNGRTIPGREKKKKKTRIASSQSWPIRKLSSKPKDQSAQITNAREREYEEGYLNAVRRPPRRTKLF